MKTVIPLPQGQSVIGQSRHNGWIVGDRFTYDGSLYQFLGKDRTGGLHAQVIPGGRLAVFDSSLLWRRPHPCRLQSPTRTVTNPRPTCHEPLRLAHLAIPARLLAMPPGSLPPGSMAR